jgi:hypothetical protein
MCHQASQTSQPTQPQTIQPSQTVQPQTTEPAQTVQLSGSIEPNGSSGQGMQNELEFSFSEEEPKQSEMPKNSSLDRESSD